MFYCLKCQGQELKPNILVVVGTRPEAIKLAPVVQELNQREGKFRVKLCSTGQHKEMLQQALSVFDLITDIDLQVMTVNQSLGNLTARLIERFCQVLQKESYDLAIVQGDTTTALSCAMAAFYEGVPVAHIEAGLRTNKLDAPFPEELNRQLISRIASLHFAPTEENSHNLVLEGVREDKIIVTGNTIVDALIKLKKSTLEDSEKIRELKFNLEKHLEFDPEVGRFVLITAHRRENFGRKLKQICEALIELAIANPRTYFVYPVHRNPQVREVVFEALWNIPNVKLLDPISHIEFLYLLKFCLFVITDSGGVQEEAPSFGKITIILREDTERVEAISSGWALLAGTSRDKVVDMSTNLLLNDGFTKGGLIVDRPNPFGDGRASQRIVDEIEKRFLD